ncbi:unnamed protein product [Nyctereutes procyonoides]|uniref:(raccoon dog) hypothetical protein n=1 Tax=Nyctereutes procyonoides TaxID=34880 RepID=A0A811ZKL8_NYCPR|nr:unnamed protein product [Nyctereutes procyonoides]
MPCEVWHINDKITIVITDHPTQNPDLINAAFPLSRPTWDYNSAEGKERLRVYRQTLMAGLKAATRKPTNLAKVYDMRQGKDESPAAFLKRVIEAFRQYTPVNPEAPETKAAIIMVFVNQAAPDIKKKLQRVKRLGEKSLQDSVIVAERVCYNNRKSPEEQQTKLSDRQTRNLAKILLATTMDDPQERRRHLKKLASGTGKEDGPGPCRERPKLNKNQCKEEHHWVKSCPNKRSKAPAKILKMEDLDN